MRASSRFVRDGLQAGLPAAILSGLPSTLHAVATGHDPLEPSVAAGSILLPNETRRGRLLVAAVPVHLFLSMTWSVVLAAVLPRKSPIAEGALAGAVIAAIDLGVAGRRYPLIRALDPFPQLADHIAFGTVAALGLARQGGHRR